MKKIFSKKPLWMNMDEAYENTQFLLKYFPKYYYKVEYQMSEIKNKKIYDKTKRVKLINKFFVQDYNESGQAKIIDLVKNSRKSVKCNNFTDSRIQRSLPKITKYRLEVQKPDSWKTLARSLSVKELTVEFCGANLLRMNDAKKKGILQRNLNWVFWRILLKLRKLKKFGLLITNDFSRLIADFFQKLNQLALFLKSLDHFSIILNCIKLEQSSSFDFLNIFGRVNNLKILELNNSLFERVLQTQHLVELRSLTLIKTTFLPGDNDEVSLDFAPFRNLKDLSNLQTLELSLFLKTPNSFKSFLESFSLPDSLKSLNLSFHETFWKDPGLGIDFDFSNNPQSFTSQKLFADFYKKWANLDQLRSFSLCFTETEDVQNPSLYFLAPIFKNLKNLKKLYYANIYNNEFGRKTAVDFNYFLESLSHMRNSLNSLIVEAHAISIKKVSLNLLKQFNFDDLALCGFILGDQNLVNLFSLFSQKRTGQIFELETLVIDNDESFSKFLENLSFIPKRTEVLLSVDVRKVSKETFVGKLAEKLNGLNKKHLGLTFRCSPSLDFGELDNLSQSISNNDGCLKSLNIYDHSGNEIYNHENSSSLLFDFNTNSSSSCFTVDNLKSEEIDEEESEDEEFDDDDYFDIEDVFDDGFDDIIDENL
jgi:hypothetical protein